MIDLTKRRFCIVYRFRTDPSCQEQKTNYGPLLRGDGERIWQIVEDLNRMFGYNRYNGEVKFGHFLLTLDWPSDEILAKIGVTREQFEDQEFALLAK